MSALAEALVAAQAELPLSLRRDADGQIGERGYRYVTFDALVEATRPILTKHGLSISQWPGGTRDEPTLTTQLVHTTGGDEALSWTMPLYLPQPTMQGLGAAITYARRYAWAAALGIASEEDDDATSVSGNGASVPEAEGAEWVWRSGKHKGSQLMATPTDYLAWYAENGPDPVARTRCRDEIERRNLERERVTADDDSVPF